MTKSISGKKVAASKKNKQKHISKIVHYFINGLFLILTVSGTIVAAYLIDAEAKHEQKQLKQHQQQALSASISQAMYHYDFAAVKALIDQSLVNKWLVGVSVGNDRDLPLIVRGMEQEKLNTRPNTQRKHYKLSTETLHYKDESIGFVRYITKPVSSQIDQILLLKAIIILVTLAFLLSLLVRRFVETRITKHIHKLTDAVNDHDTKQLQTLSEHKSVPHELGLLASEFLASNAQLVSEATEDFLTSLPNRRAFESKLHHLLSNQIKFVLGLIDVDHFKQVNDTFGHDVGDTLLVACAKVLRNTMADNGYAARLGGDEFAFIIQGTLDQATSAADAIIRGVKQISNDSSEIRIDISASIGLAGPLERVSAQDALRFVDIALYKSKNAGRARYTVYRAGFDEQPKRWIQVQTALTQALSIGYLNYELEPINYLSNQSTYGVEMLLRLRDDEGNFIPPLEVIDIAVQTGQLEALSRSTIDSGIAVLKFHTEVSNVFLNFSSTELFLFDTPELFRKIHELGSLKKRLIFEITESAYLEDPKTVDILNKLRSTGIRIALDDFGTGYSSLACLSTLPLDYVKIDQSIVSKSFEDPQARTILRVILALRQEFDFEVIAEGIESEPILEFLQCEDMLFGQGYLFNTIAHFTSSLAALPNRPFRVPVNH